MGSQRKLDKLAARIERDLSDLDELAELDLAGHDRLYDLARRMETTSKAKTWGCVMLGRPRTP